jgi:hypothetical protein
MVCVYVHHKLPDDRTIPAVRSMLGAMALPAFWGSRRSGWLVAAWCMGDAPFIVARRFNRARLERIAEGSADRVRATGP